MWSNGWVMSNCSQDSQKVCTKLLSLPDNAKKQQQFLVPQLKQKFAPSPKLHPQSDHINTHTNQVKTLRMDLSWDHFNSSLQFFFLLVFFLLEDFFKVSSHMKVPPDHYKGPQATSKGHAHLVDSGCRHGKANEFQSRHCV